MMLAMFIEMKLTAARHNARLICQMSPSSAIAHALDAGILRKEMNIERNDGDVASSASCFHNDGGWGEHTIQSERVKGSLAKYRASKM